MRRLLVAAGLLALLAGGAVLVLPPLLFGDGVDYSHVVSIENTREYQDATLLARAWQLPVAAAYRRGGLDFQRNPSFCGPTTAVNLLRSLGTPAEQATILDGSAEHTTFGMLFGGITLDRLADLVRLKTGRNVTVLRDLDLPTFRSHVARANDLEHRYLVNFSRGPLFGRGGGHHSPIVAYLDDADLVLVLDVNRKYQPWLVRTARLFEAVDTTDPQSHRKRGLLEIR